MEEKNINFISEVFWTTDEMYSFQKVGRYYRLYDRDSGYAFLKEFTSFKSMQDFMNESRNKNAKEEKRNV